MYLVTYCIMHYHYIVLYMFSYLASVLKKLISIFKTDQRYFNGKEAERLCLLPIRIQNATPEKHNTHKNVSTSDSIIYISDSRYHKFNEDGKLDWVSVILILKSSNKKQGRRELTSTNDARELCRLIKKKTPPRT